MRFAAYIEMLDKRRIPVMPRSHKRRTFDSIESARMKLESVTRRWKMDSRGLIFTSEGELVYTIAL